MAAYDNVRELRGDVRDQLKHLRAQVDSLMDERVTPVLGDAADRAQRAARRAADYTSDGADVVADRVRDQPLIAIGVAAAVGFLLGRVSR